MPILTNSDYSRNIKLLSRPTNLPLDLTGFDLQLIVKAQRTDQAALITLGLGSGLTVADPTSGTVTMSLDHLQTAAIGAGDRYFALFRVDAGRRLALATGKMIVREGL